MGRLVHRVHGARLPSGGVNRLRLSLVVVLALFFALAISPVELIDDLTRTWLVGNTVAVLMIAILVRRSRSHPDERPWTLPVLLAVVSFAVGANAFMVFPPVDNRPSELSLAAYLVVYPALLAGILAALHRHVQHSRLIVALDGVTGALAAAAVVSGLTADLVDRIMSGDPRDGWFALAYVIGDIGIITAGLGALGVVGLAAGRSYAVWVLGMLVFGTADILYADALSQGSYVIGGYVDGFWVGGLALITVGATMTQRAQPRSVPPAKTLAVVLLAPLVAVAVLVLAPDWREDPLPSVLALGALAGATTRFVLAFVQVRELAEVRHQALTDELTGAGNRRALYRRLDELLDDPDHPVSEPARLALALIDLDHFKEVNDSLGHATGDELLQAVVGRFSEALDAQGTPYLLTRLGGDEFAVVLEGVRTTDAAHGVGTALRSALLEPIELGRARLHVRASIGLALTPDHGLTRSDLLFAADSAMYAAKGSVEPVCLYSPSGGGDRRNRLAIAEELYTALERKELSVAYQPIRTSAGGLVAVEALVRWDHPEKGRMNPGEFLDIAERYQLTHLIAERVLDLTLGDLARWRRTHPTLTASVNISALDLRDESIVGTVAAALIAHGVAPDALTIEVTETAMMRDPETSQAVLHALADLGVELSVDDYGTGYSSLEYLLELPIDEIKLDRAFSAKLLENDRSVSIVRSTVELTHALGLRMVGEGVEGEEQLTILDGLGCDRVQGWHLGRPMSREALDELLDELADAAVRRRDG